MTYRFSEKGHKHELLIDGKWQRLTGVTTILGVIAKPALIGWAANMAVDYILAKEEDYTNKILPLDSPITGTEPTIEIDLELFEDTCQEARKAHQRKKEEAGQKGTDVHAIIEEIIKTAIANTNGIINWNGDHENKQVNHFIKWAKENNIRFTASEKSVYSQKMFIGGIIDFMCEIDGQTWIGDIKTSSGIYPEHFFQTAGYQLCLEEMGEQSPIGHVIVNPKKDGTFEEKRSVSNEDNKDAFLAALKIYRIQEKLKSSL